MFNSKSLFKLIFLFIIYPIGINADCTLRLIENPPLLVRILGSRRFYQNYKGNVYITLKPGEIVEAYCSTSLIAKNYRYFYEEKDDVHKATFQCTPKGIFIKNYSEAPSYENTMEISCTSQSIMLYESNQTLSNCDLYMSYGIGAVSLQNTDLTVGICYDLDTLSIKYAKYLTRQAKSFLPVEHDLGERTVISLDTILDNFNSLFSFEREQNVLRSLSTKLSTNMLLEDQLFDYSSLTQDKNFFEYKDNFKDMFNIIWWRNLREGNWKFFLEALRERIENVTYMVYTGVSDTLTLPSFNNCKATEALEINVNDKLLKVPAYIYTYLQSLKPHSDEEFVVIAYNTPYYTDGKSIEFCEDMCSEIDWLNGRLFAKTHLMPMYGVVVCCRPEEVANKLENFPYEQNNTTATSTKSPV